MWPSSSSLARIAFFHRSKMTRLSRTLLVASLLGLFPTGLLLPIYAIFVKNIGGDILDAGIAYGLFSISSGVFVLVVTKTHFFKTHLRGMVVLGYTLVTLGQLGYFLVETPLHLFITQVIIGIATGLLDPSWDSLFSFGKNEADAVRSWSLWSGGQRIVTGFGAMAGAFVVGAYSFTLLFGIMFVFNLLAVFISLRLFLKEKYSSP